MIYIINLQHHFTERQLVECLVVVLICMIEPKMVQNCSLASLAKPLTDSSMSILQSEASIRDAPRMTLPAASVQGRPWPSTRESWHLRMRSTPTRLRNYCRAEEDNLCATSALSRCASGSHLAADAESRTLFLAEDPSHPSPFTEGRCQLFCADESVWTPPRSMINTFVDAVPSSIGRFLHVFHNQFVEMYWYVSWQTFQI